MLSLTAGELSFAILLVALIAAAPWIPRLGEKVACLLAGGVSEGASAKSEARAPESGRDGRQP